jgi:hypothetical protein
MWVIASVLSGSGNVIGTTYKYALPAAFFIGLLAPKVSLYLMVIMAGYLDVFKKMMVAGGDMYFTDVFFILGMPCVMLVGICTQVVVGWLTRKNPLTKEVAVLFIISLILVIVTAVTMIAQSGMKIEVLKGLANTSAYCALIFTLPTLLKTPEDIRAFLRFSVFIMIPAAFHALGHYFIGPFEFEDIYMLSGFSTSLVYWLDGEGIFGPFSSQGPLATVMTLCATLCAVAFIQGKEIEKEHRIFTKKVATILFILFITTAVLSLKRGPLLILPLFILGVITLRSLTLTIVAYSASLILLVSITVYSQTLADSLEGWQSDLNILVGSNLADSGIFRIRTFTTRFLDFNLLTESKNWQPFGAAFAQGEQAYYIHVLPVKLLMKYGYVPMSILITCVVPVFFFLHRRLLRRCCEKTVDSNLVLMMTSLTFSMILGTGLGLVVIPAYPNPFFLGCFAAVAISGVIRKRQAILVYDAQRR